MVRLRQRRWIARLTEIAPTALHPATRSASRTRFRIIIAVSIAVSFSFPAHAESAGAGPAQSADPWQSFIDEAASRFSVPASWIRAVIRIESNGNPKAVSPKGAVGLMQLMPDTYTELRLRYGLGDDPKDPHDNIIAGAAYLHDMHERFGREGFIAAYNAGPRRYEDHLAIGQPLPAETLAYVAKLTPLLSGAPSAGGPLAVSNHLPWQQSPLFVTRPSDQSPDKSAALVPQKTRTRNDRAIADLSALVPLPGTLFVRKPESRAKP